MRLYGLTIIIKYTIIWYIILLVRLELHEDKYYDLMKF